MLERLEATYHYDNKGEIKPWPLSGVSLKDEIGISCERDRNE